MGVFPESASNPLESPQVYWLRRARKLGSPLLAAKIFNYYIKNLV